MSATDVAGIDVTSVVRNDGFDDVVVVSFVCSGVVPGSGVVVVVGTTKSFSCKMTKKRKQMSYYKAASL